MSKISVKNFVITLLIILAAIIFLQFLYYVNSYFDKVKNHRQIETLLQTDLKYRWDKMDSDIIEINKLLEKKNCFDEDLGLLYQRAGLIYLQQGETMLYYKYLGYSLYYLQKSDNKAETINTYLDLANFYINNYSYDAAKKMLDYAMEVQPFEEIEDLKVKSYAYRMLGVLNIFKLNYNEAETYLLTSQKILNQSHSGLFEEEYSAMNDVWLARIYEETGRLPKCRDNLEKWENHDMFTSPIYRKLILRDFIIPYYQTRCYYLCAENIKERNGSSKFDTEARENAVIEYLNEFMDLCEENDYEKAELYTLLKIQKEYPTKNETIQNELYSVLNQLYATLFNQQNITYTEVVSNIVDDAHAELVDEANLHQTNVKKTNLAILLGSILGLILLSFVILIYNNRFDALTGLLTRRVFNIDIHMIAHSNIPYAVIMIDIDDFKRVNDTYGHPEGDIVLWRLGQLISKENTSDIHGYRYGGEEFAIITYNTGYAYATAIGERIRKYMEQQAWEFDPDIKLTLSVGVATGRGNDDVLKKADNNLYYSKTHGKNQVTS